MEDDARVREQTSARRLEQLRRQEREQIQLTAMASYRARITTLYVLMVRTCLQPAPEVHHQLTLGHRDRRSPTGWSTR